MGTAGDDIGEEDDFTGHKAVFLFLLDVAAVKEVKSNLA
jgi:hypothetical protein